VMAGCGPRLRDFASVTRSTRCFLRITKAEGTDLERNQLDGLLTELECRRHEPRTPSTRVSER